MTMKIESVEERERLRKEFWEAYEALQKELAKIPPDELDRLRQEVIDEVDEAIRQKAIRLQQQAS